MIENVKTYSEQCAGGSGVASGGGGPQIQVDQTDHELNCMRILADSMKRFDCTKDAKYRIVEWFYSKYKRPQA